MKDNRIEIFQAYQEVNKRPINQAIIKMEEKFNPQWEQPVDIIAVAQAVIMALEEGDHPLHNRWEVDKMTEIMYDGLTEGLYSKKEVEDFQNQVIEAELDEGKPIIQVQDILEMKTLEELNWYLTQAMDWILTEMSKEYSELSRR